jgi:NusA-like KH domain protein
MKITYNFEIMGFMRIFGQITNANLKDCFIDNNSLLTFIVVENEIGKAIGKKAVKVKMLEKALKRKVKIVEFNKDSLEFIKNAIFPLKVENIEDTDTVVTIKSPDTKTKSLLIGRNAQNLRNLENVARRYFTIEEIKVV